MHGGYGSAKAEAQTEAPHYPEEAQMDTGPVPHVSRAVMDADVEAEHLLQAIRELESRLGDVLRPSLDSADKAMGVPHEPLVALAERISSHNGTIRMARQYVVSILDRLEL